MKQKIASFLLFVYLQHIKEDWDLYTPLGRFFIMPAWFIYSTMIWIISPIFIPQYLIVNSESFKQFQHMARTYTPEQIKEMKRAQTQNFLNKRFNGNKNNKLKRRK